LTLEPIGSLRESVIRGRLESVRSGRIGYTLGPIDASPFTAESNGCPVPTTYASYLASFVVGSLHHQLSNEAKMPCDMTRNTRRFESDESEQGVRENNALIGIRSSDRHSDDDVGWER
jgi:hypothetical protein